MPSHNSHPVTGTPTDPATGRGLLRVTSTHFREGLTLLAVDGSIDMFTVPQLAAAILEALSGQPRGLIIDLAAVDFLSSAGMAMLLAAHEAISPTSHLGVVAAHPVTTRPLQMMGVDHTLPLYPTLADAIAATTRGAT